MSEQDMSSFHIDPDWKKKQLESTANVPAAEEKLPDRDDDSSAGNKKASAELSENKTVNGKKSKRTSGGGRKRSRKPLIIALLAVLVVAMAIVLYIRFAPNRTRMDIPTYFTGLMENAAGNGEAITLEDDEIAVILQNHAIAQPGIMGGDNGDVFYMNYDVVRANMNSRFYWDLDGDELLYTTQSDIWHIPANSKTYTVGNEQKTYDSEIILSNDRGKFINMNFVAEYTNVEFNVLADEKHALVNYDWSPRLTATVKKAGAVRYTGGIKSEYLTKVAKGDTVYVLEEGTDWDYVVTTDGYLGWIEKKRLEDPEEKAFTREFTYQEYSNLVRDHKINLVWDQVDNADANAYFANRMKDVTGINVVSPTWFKLTDDYGSISSISSAEYVKKAHAAGIEVWGLVDNFSPDMSTAELVSHSTARKALIGNLIGAALGVGLDGINIDFETIKEEAGYDYVQFMRELSIACRTNNLVLSVDIPVPMDFNKHYNRQELGNVCDYVIIMGYDEHYYGSEAGSVASLTFEENGIANTLAQGVPAEKIISGIPFYTRIWNTETLEDGTVNTSSQIYGMEAAAKTLKTYGVDVKWDEELGQNVAEWTLDNGILCQVWLEDLQSIAKKAELVPKYNLGGIAEWVLGNQSNDVWAVISDTAQIDANAQNTPIEPETEAPETEAQTEGPQNEAVTESTSEAE